MIIINYLKSYSCVEICITLEYFINKITNFK